MLLPPIINQKQLELINQKTTLEFYSFILESLIKTNEKFLPELEHKELLLNYPKKVLQLSLLINQTNEQTLIVPLYRKLLEVVVFFRLTVQDTTLTEELLKRQLLWKRMELRRFYKKGGPVHNPYRMGTVNQLAREYDWANPLFSESFLKKKTLIKYSPSFRDLLAVTKRVDTTLLQAEYYYGLASSLLHFSFIEEELEKDRFLVKEECIRLIKAFLKDTVNYCKNTNNGKNEALIKQFQSLL